MRKRKFAVGSDCKQLLETALTKRLPLSITSKNSSDSWQVSKSHVLDIQTHKLVIAMPLPHAGESPIEPEASQEIAITFKKGYNKCLFVTRVISQGHFEVEEGMPIASLTIYKPEQIEKVQRRVYERTSVPSDSNITVDFSPCNDNNTKHSGKLLNLSGGGIGVLMPTDSLPQLDTDQQCDIEFAPLSGQGPITAQARFRHITEHTPGISMLGFQFIGLEVTEEGRNTLRRIGRAITIYGRKGQLAGK